MVEFSFGTAEGSFLLLNGQKHLRSVAENLTNNKQKRTQRIYQKRRRYEIFRRHGKMLKK